MAAPSSALFQGRIIYKLVVQPPPCQNIIHQQEAAALRLLCHRLSDSRAAC